MAPERGDPGLDLDAFSRSPKFKIFIFINEVHLTRLYYVNVK